MSAIGGPSERRPREAELRDREASGYRERYRREKGAWWDDLEIALLLRPITRARAARVMDAGAGVGRVALALAERDCAVDAFDVSRVSLQIMMRDVRARAMRVRAVVCDLSEGIPVGTSTYDAVVSGQAIQHLPLRGSRVRAWREMARACRQGAFLSATVYHLKPWQAVDGSWPGGPAFHRYGATDLAAELAESGWAPRSIRAYYRSTWRWLPSKVAALLERCLAAAHLLDDRATYVHVIAVKAGGTPRPPMP